MNDVEPFQDGDRLTIRHLGGREAEVIFCGVHGIKFDQVYVEWPLAGQYRVKLDTGQMSPKSVSLWKVVEEDLARLRATSVVQRQAARDRLADGRGGRR